MNELVNDFIMYVSNFDNPEEAVLSTNINMTMNKVGDKIQICLYTPSKKYVEVVSDYRDAYEKFGQLFADNRNGIISSFFTVKVDFE